MRKIKPQEQLEEMLCRQERETVSEVLKRVEKEDREAVCLALLALAKFPSLNYQTDDPFVSIVVSGLLPYVEQSLKKANDPAWCMAHPDDAP